MPIGKKIRVYDLAREIKQDTKRVMEDLRREGADISVPSNSVSAELADKVRSKYFPKTDTAPKRTIKVIKAAKKDEAYGFCKQGIDRPSFDLFRYQANADKDRDKCSEKEHRAQTQVDDRSDLLTGRELAKENCGGHDQQNEQHQVKKHAVTNGFAKCITGDCKNM
jgi:hypothetical protein